MAKAGDKKMYVSVMCSVEVSEAEWMDRFGDMIAERGMVPVVTLVNSVKLGVKKHFEGLGLNYLVLDQPETAKQKQVKSDHS